MNSQQQKLFDALRPFATQVACVADFHSYQTGRNPAGLKVSATTAGSRTTPESASVFTLENFTSEPIQRRRNITEVKSEERTMADDLPARKPSELTLALK